MTKRKLSPHSGSIAKRQLNRIHKRGHKFKAFFMLQFSFAAHDFLYLYTHIRFSINKPNFYYKGKGRIFTDGFNKINLSTIQFNVLNFQIKQFIIFQKFSWNSV